MIETILILISYSFFDGMRDGTLTLKWWPRHIWKWLAFYTPIIFIAIKSNVHILHFAWIGVACWLFWWLAVKYICKKDWESIWIRLFKWIFKIDTTKNK